MPRERRVSRDRGRPQSLGSHYLTSRPADTRAELRGRHQPRQPARRRRLVDGSRADARQDACERPRSLRPKHLVTMLANRGFGEQGPPRDTTFAEVERFRYQAGRRPPTCHLASQWPRQRRDRPYGWTPATPTSTAGRTSVSQTGNHLQKPVIRSRPSWWPSWIGSSRGCSIGAVRFAVGNSTACPAPHKIVASAVAPRASARSRGSVGSQALARRRLPLTPFRDPLRQIAVNDLRKTTGSAAALGQAGASAAGGAQFGEQQDSSANG